MMEGKRKADCPGLPPGWTREECVRQCGLSAGKTDVYYFSPEGVKIRSKPQLARYLGESFDLSAFDFRTGKLLTSALRKRMRHDASLALPIRQTASIFKQPVTVIRNHPDSNTKSDIKHGPQDPPRQLFWEKRLQGLKASDSSHETIEPLNLPNNVQGIGPELTTENILQSISAALHLSNMPVTGQNASKSAIQKHPNVLIDVNQPHIQQLIVSDDDIRRQESRVLEARKKLQEIMK